MRGFCKLAFYCMAKVNEYRCCKLAVFLFCVSCISVQAQNKCRLVLYPVDENIKNTPIPTIPSSFDTKNACIQYVSQLPSLLMSQGYISASVDSVWEDSANVYCKLFSGEKYIWDSVWANEETWQSLKTIGVNRSSFSIKPFDQNKILDTYNKLLAYFESNGYPFAKIYLDSIKLSNGSVSARINADKGFEYFIDSIHITGNARITNDFLYRYLDIKQHDIYDQNKLNNINARLSQLLYIEQSQPWTVAMHNTGATLNLNLDARRSNQVNVLVGLLPANTELGGKLLLTGEAMIDLKNPFGNGETIGVHWQQLQSKSPRLDLVFQRPYIFHSSFGFNFNFQLYKRDSAYLNINSQIGLQYILSSKQSGTVYLQTAKTNLLNVDTATVILTKTLPPNIDMNSLGLALQYDFNNTNYHFNPRSGNELQIVTAFGNRTIKKNNTILNIKDENFNYNNLYDTLKQKGYQVRIRTSAAHYFPLGKQAVVKTALNVGWFNSPNYFQNELFQIGGYKLLRGFDEESIYTNKFIVGTLEYRYLLSQNSYLFGFTDLGKANYQSNTIKYSHTYLGIGAGIAFETGAGIFNISFAEGKRNDASFDFRQSKIHLGFVSLF